MLQRIQNLSVILSIVETVVIKDVNKLIDVLEVRSFTHATQWCSSDGSTLRDLPNRRHVGLREFVLVEEV